MTADLILSVESAAPVVEVTLPSCPTCDGEGGTREPEMDGYGGGAVGWSWEPCPHCDGSGTVDPGSLIDRPVRLVRRGHFVRGVDHPYGSKYDDELSDPRWVGQATIAGVGININGLAGYGYPFPNLTALAEAVPNRGDAAAVLSDLERFHPPRDWWPCRCDIGDNSHGPMLPGSVLCSTCKDYGRVSVPDPGPVGRLT